MVRLTLSVLRPDDAGVEPVVGWVLLLLGLVLLGCALLAVFLWLLRLGHHGRGDAAMGHRAPRPRRLRFDPTLRPDEYWSLVAQTHQPYREFVAHQAAWARGEGVVPSATVQALCSNFAEQTKILDRMLTTNRSLLGATSAPPPLLPADPPTGVCPDDAETAPRAVQRLWDPGASWLVGDDDAPPAPVYFKPGEPRTFADYAGQEAVVQYLASAVRGRRNTPRATDPEGLAIPHQLFYGLPGLGKTLLAKVLAHELSLDNARYGAGPAAFLEAFPSDIPDVKALDRYLRRVQRAPGCVLFIDEIHDFTEKHLRKLYLVLEEGRYKFEDEPDPVTLPPFTIIGATTDPGQMPSAFKRRFVRWPLKPATPEELFHYVMGRAKGNLPIDEGAVDEIIAHTHFSGAPWEALQVYELAAVFARGEGDTRVRPAHVRQVLTSQDIDALGLGWQDRQVLQFLFTQPKYRTVRGVRVFDVFAASEENVCRMAGVDRGEYRDTIRPKLFARGLLQLHTKGQALTASAIEQYGHLIPTPGDGAPGPAV